MRYLRKSDVILALIAVVLAGTTHWYVNDFLEQKEAKSYDPSYKLIKLTAKPLPVHVRIATKPPEGYHLIQEKVIVNPRHIVVIAPEALIEETSTAETAIMDLSQSTARVTKRVPIESVAGVHLSGEPTYVEVTVPIEKLDVNQ